MPIPPARFLESDPSARSLCRELLRYSINNSFALGSSDDGVPVAPSRVLKMQDGVSPSSNPEGWLENLVEVWLALVNRGVLGPLHQSKAATAHAYRHRDRLPLLANSGLCEFFSVCFFLGALSLNALCGPENDGLSGPTVAQLTVLAGLHNRVEFT